MQSEGDDLSVWMSLSHRPPKQTSMSCASEDLPWRSTDPELATSRFLRAVAALPGQLRAVELPELQEVLKVLLGHRLPVGVRQPKPGPLLLRKYKDGVGVARHLARASRVPAHPIRDASLADVALRAGAAHLEPAPPALGGEGALVVAPRPQQPVEEASEVCVPAVCQTRLQTCSSSRHEHTRPAVRPQGSQETRAAIWASHDSIIPTISVICALRLPVLSVMVGRVDGLRGPVRGSRAEPQSVGSSGDGDVRERGSSNGKRKLCVGRGIRCFVCRGRGSSGPVPGLAGQASSLPRACPVCGGRGRAIVLDSGDGRTGLCDGPS